jgi:hypothetical protein
VPTGGVHRNRRTAALAVVVILALVLLSGIPVSVASAARTAGTPGPATELARPTTFPARHPPDSDPAARATNPELGWVNLTGVSKSAPSARYLPMMTYDAADGYVLLFGGATASTAFGDTWSFNNGTWTNLTGRVGTAPAGRYAGALAYDPIDHYVLLFGGEEGGGRVGSDTWKFANGSWQELYPTAHPQGTWRSTFTYDAADQYMLLYGGSTVSGSPNSETWSYAHGTWTNLTANVSGSPQPRFRAAMTYDSEDGYSVLFGGCTDPLSLQCATADTWTYVNDTWKNITLSAGTGPVARVYASLVDDPSIGSAVLFGGSSTPVACYPCQTYADTWTFHNGTWRSDAPNLTSSPPSRGFAAMTYVPDPGYLLLFGGAEINASLGTMSFLNDTWSLGAPILGSFVLRPSRVDLGQSAQLSVNAFGPAPPLSYNYSGLPPGCAGANSSAVLCAPDRVGNYTITAFVNDSAGHSINRTADLSVWTDPVIRSFTARPAVITAGANLTLNASVALGAPGPYRFDYGGLPAGCSSANASSLTCRPSAGGNYTIRLAVTDTDGFRVSANATVRVNGVASVGFYASPATTDVNVSVELHAAVSNGTAPFEYVYSGLPPGCAPADTPTLACAPSVAGFYTIRVNVTDSYGFVTEGRALIAVNLPPAIEGFRGIPSALDLGQSLAFVLGYSGGTGSPSFAYSGAPPGCVFGNTTTPACTPAATGNFAVTVSATDGLGAEANATALVSVAPLPVVSALNVSPTEIDLGQTFAANATVSGGTGPMQLLWSGLPSACQGPSTLAFECTPRATGEVAFFLTVVDAAGGRASSALALVRVQPAPAILSVATTAPTVVAGEHWSFWVEVGGGTGVYSYSYSGLPAGCASVDTANLSCAPKGPGNYTPRVVVTDSAGLSVRGTVTLNVSAATAVAITPVPPAVPAYAFVTLVGIAAAMAVALGVSLWRRAPPRAPRPRARAPGAKPDWLEE